MPKSKKKSNELDLINLLLKKQAQILNPIIKANSKQFAQIANIIAESSDTIKTLNSVYKSLLLPVINELKTFKFPEIPSSRDTPKITFLRHDPPVVIKKSKWEIEKEAREIYRTELQIQALEQQLNLYKGMLAPQYDISTGVISFLGKQIEIPLNTKLEMVCRIVLKNVPNMKRKWSWDEIVEANRENSSNFTSRQIYTAVRSINDKVAVETQVKDLLLSKPLSTVQLNPKFIAK